MLSVDVIIQIHFWMNRCLQCEIEKYLIEIVEKQRNEHLKFIAQHEPLVHYKMKCYSMVLI